MLGIKLKIYQCESCHAIFRHESDKQEHGKNDVSHQKCQEYELEEFLTRFLVAS
jgi:hypothetical protein